MNEYSTPNILKPEYLLKELVHLLQNDSKSAPRLMENLMNVDYDFSTKEGYYKLLNQEQRELLNRIHLRRKESPAFDELFQMYLLIASGMVGLGYAAVKLIEKIEKNK